MSDVKLSVRWPSSGNLTTRYGTFHYRQWPDRSEIEWLVGKDEGGKRDTHGNYWRAVAAVPSELVSCIPHSRSAGSNQLELADGGFVTFTFEEVEPVVPCRVYWGSHGCHHPHGHDGPHECDCCDCDDHATDRAPGCVAKPPYYGPDTRFYGEDA